jgi:SUR7/PalI family
MYWFNPVEILLSELLAGATIALPSEVNTILELIRIASHIMFGGFLTGICMNTVSIFATPLAIFSRWWSLPIALWTFVAALLTVLGSIIGTVMAVIFKVVLTAQPGLNIGASVGVPMLIFMWIASICTVVGHVIHLVLACCCASRRDVETGRRSGDKAGYSSAISSEKNKSAVARFGMSQISRFRGKMAAANSEVGEDAVP